MSFINGIKKYILVIVPAAVFAAWLAFLIITATVSSRYITFFDDLHQVDVSNQYSSDVPIERYLLEPFAGYAFTLAKQLENSLLLILVGYVLVRFIFSLFNRVIVRKSTKREVLVEYARNVANFYWKYAFLGFIVIFLIVITGMVTTGALFMHQDFMSCLEALFIAWVGMLGAKIVVNAVKFFKKEAKFHIKPPKPWMHGQRNEERFHVHKPWDVIGRETRYCITGFMIYAMICLNLISTYFPPQVIHTNLQDGEMLMDFHCHTTLSDGFLTPEERVNWYIGQGLQGAAITDHMNTNGGLQALAYVQRRNLNFTIIIGQEYTKYSPRIHLNVYGINETIPTDEYLGGNTSPSALPPMNVSEMIHYVKTHGGYVLVNHYNDGGDPYSLADLRDWGVDGFEIVNGGGDRGAGIRNFCAVNGLIATASSDEDSSQPIPCFTRLKLADPANRSIHAIFAALKNNATTQCVIVRQHDNSIPWPDELDDFRPLRNFIVYLRSIDIGQMISWIAWSCSIFALYIVAFFWIRKKMNGEIQKAKIVADPKKRSFLFSHSKIVLVSIIAAVAIFLLLTQYLLVILAGLE
nr:PHP domain-containing protein [Candidatus Sigynarchaeota archaeon]